MAGTTLGFIRYVLGLDTIAFKKGMTEADRDLVKLQKSFEKKGEQLAGLGAKLSIGLSAPLTAFAAKGIAEAQETAAAMAQVTSALASMGPVAGRTAAQLEAAANAFETQSLYEGDQILKDVTANLLTFGRISGPVFDQAQQAALNLATRLNVDLKSAALLVGKALNDPVKGMGALGKAGIQFSADQKAAIKAMADTGNIAGAQAIILGEFKKQFDGAAAAAQNADPFNAARDAFNSMAETVGTALLPLIPPLTNAVVSVANAFASLSPETQKWLIIAGGVAVAIGPVLVGLGALVSTIATIGPAVAALSTAFAALKVAFLAARVAAVATLPALLPFLVPLAAIAAAVGAAYLAWKNWDKIAPIVQRMVAGVKNALNMLLAPFKTVIGWTTKVAEGFYQMAKRVVLNSDVPDMVDGIQQHFARLDGVMVNPALTATGKVGQAFADLRAKTKETIDRLFPEFQRMKDLLTDWAVLDKAAASGLISGQLRDEGKARAGGIKDEWSGPESTPLIDTKAMSDSFDRYNEETIEKLVIPTERATADVIESFGQMAAGAIGSVRSMTKAFKSGDILGGIQDMLNLVTDVIRMLGQAGIIKGIPAGMSYGGPRANGGPVASGRSYLVGERGPEIFSPGSSGRIVANDRIGGGVTHNHFSGNLLTPEFWAQISAGDRSAALSGASGAVGAMGQRQRRAFP